MSSQNNPLSEIVLSQLNQRGISKEAAVSQIGTFERGIPFTEILRPCTIGDGINNIDDHIEKYVEIFESEAPSLKVTKFVPASGAASRMFKELLSVSSGVEEVSREVLEAEDSKNSKTFLSFVDNINKFAFYESLKAIMANDNLDLDALLVIGTYKDIADYILVSPGLNYANLPKGIIEFHNYANGPRTAFEEHLFEAHSYSRDKNNISRLHFTLSEEHLDKVSSMLAEKVTNYDSEYDISYSVQKPSTDTLAVDMENKPFLDSEGNVVLRPGGHGALIENLNDLDSDIAFIKNIDNVVPDRLKIKTVMYKRALGGYLLEIQTKVFGYLKHLDYDRSDKELIEEISSFVRDELKIELQAGFGDLSDDQKKEYIRTKLNRPIRVCGVVKNVGEPGGGPFWIRNSFGEVSKQIVESAQVNLESPEQKKIWESSTHFNPVDLVCGLKDYQGNTFDLKDYVDPNMGFISNKSKDGRDLKALELPGLWNGAMADWITLFVEVPLITFNPVKGILDLLRPEHQ